jgi:hypothetical protein
MDLHSSLSIVLNHLCSLSELVGVFLVGHRSGFGARDFFRFVRASVARVPAMPGRVRTFGCD